MDEEGYPVDQEDMQDDQGGEVEDDPVVIIGQYNLGRGRRRR